MAAAALGLALVLGWPSPEPDGGDDGRRTAWQRSLGVPSYTTARTGGEVGGDAAAPLSLSVSAKERVVGPRLVARVRRLVPEEGLAPLEVDPAPPVALDDVEERPAVAALEEPAAAPPPAETVIRRGPPPSRVPAWLRHAVAASPVDDRPVVAVILDDLGLRRRETAALIDLPAPLTLAFLPYAAGVQRQASAAREAGHEVLVHVPMEPQGGEDPGPGALLTSLPDDEFRSRLRRYLGRFDGYVGVNNHMGSRATEDRGKMALVMEELRQRGLLFVDSRTTPRSVAGTEALRRGVPHAGRDVFLDNVAEVAYIRAQLDKVETVARRTGAAVAIGHPYPETVEALAGWLPQLQARGLALVPVSAVVARRLCRDGTLPAACRAYAALHDPVR